jgi:hypothetical protein
MAEVESLADGKKRIEKQRYARLVLKVFDEMEHADKREFLDRKGETQIKARERL